MQRRPAHGFYGLGLAAQMIVWAVRKRLHLYAFGADDTRVAEALRLAKLEALYSGLMSIVDVLSCGASSKIELHGVACGCLAPHEIDLLNALARLQAGDKALAYRHICGLLGPVGARLVWAAMTAIVGDLDAQLLRLKPVSALAVATADPDRAHQVLH